MPWWESSAFWGIASFIGGIIVAAFFFIAGKKKTLLEHYKFTTPLITEKMAGILNGRMSIDNQPIKSLTSTTISFINSGNQRIKSSDFSTQEPLRVVLKGHLYGYDVSRGNQKLLPKIEPVNEKILNISFENLKQRQFFSVTILHDETLDVFGELTTGTMREYGDSKIPLRFLTILYLVCVVLIVDNFYRGPIVNLIGDLAILLIMLIFFVLLCFFAVDTYKILKRRKLFMH